MQAFIENLTTFCTFFLAQLTAIANFFLSNPIGLLAIALPLFGVILNVVLKVFSNFNNK